jgi:protein arginine kinase activator
MVCEECGRPATVHVTTIAGGQRQDHHLCENCAREKGELEFLPDPQKALETWIASLAGLAGQAQATVGSEVAIDLSCPHCGQTFHEFAQTSQLGCEHCYKALATGLAPVIAHVQGTAPYHGKLPSKLEGAVRRQKDIRRLREALERHVAGEEYEEAAQVRDQLRALEREGAAPSAGGAAGAGPQGESEPRGEGDGGGA